MNFEVCINTTEAMNSTEMGRSLILKSEISSPAFVELLNAPTSDYDGDDAQDISIGVFRKKDIEHIAICMTETIGITYMNDVDIQCKISKKVVNFHSQGQDLVCIYGDGNETHVKATDLLKAIDAICFRRSKKGN